MSEPRYSAEKRFRKRYCDPETGELRVKIEFVCLDPEEWAYQSRKIFEAYKDVLAGLLGRPATEDEIFGKVNIEPGILENLKKKNIPVEVEK